MNLQQYSKDYLLGIRCALHIHSYTAEIEADFQGIGKTSQEFESGFTYGIREANQKLILQQLLEHYLLTSKSQSYGLQL